MKSKTYNQYLGGRGGTGDLHLMSSYGARAIVVNAMKIDAGTTGQIVARTRHTKTFTYDNMIQHNFNPTRAFLFLPPDGGTTAHEAMSGSVVTIGGGLPGLQTGSLLGASRYGTEFNYLPQANSALLVAAQTLAIAENAGQAWSFSCWARPRAAGATTLYMDHNAAITSNIQIGVTATQAVNVSRTNGGAAWTSAAGVVPLFVWTHIGITHTAAGNDQLYINGVASGGVRVGTAGVGYTCDRAGLNSFASFNDSAFYVTQNNVVYTADDFLQQYEDMTRDDYEGNFVLTTANTIKGGSATVVFCTEGSYGWDPLSYTLHMPLLPICEIENANGIFLLEVTTYYESEAL